jgi:hypothetical protein
MAKFTEHELKWLEGHSEALRLVAEYNDAQESQADSMGADSCAEHHKARRQELVREAQRIEEKWTGPITRVEDLSKVTASDASAE